MAGCVYMYHLQRILACFGGAPYDGTVDFNSDGLVNMSDLFFALTHWCG